MTQKHLYFRFLFFGLFFLPSLTASNVIPQLQLPANCGQPSNDPCDPETSFCNSDGQCQCKLGYSVSSNTSGWFCDRFECSTTEQCSELYQDSYATCERTRDFTNGCQCFDGFRLDNQTQKCVLKKPNTLKLGAHCVVDRQCGEEAKCTIGTAECRCPAGTIRATDYSCAVVECDSNEFCHKNVSANTACLPNHWIHGHSCQCPEPYFAQDVETFACVRVKPETVKLGAKCTSSNQCVDHAGCASDSKVCKCQLGFEAIDDMTCERVRCQKDEHCQKNVSWATVCRNDGDINRSYCKCMDRFYEDSNFECRASM